MNYPLQIAVLVAGAHAVVPVHFREVSRTKNHDDGTAVAGVDVRRGELIELDGLDDSVDPLLFFSQMAKRRMRSAKRPLRDG